MNFCLPYKEKRITKDEERVWNTLQSSTIFPRPIQAVEPSRENYEHKRGGGEKRLVLFLQQDCKAISLY